MAVYKKGGNWRLEINQSPISNLSLGLRRFEGGDEVLDVEEVTTEEGRGIQILAQFGLGLVEDVGAGLKQGR